MHIFAHALGKPGKESILKFLCELVEAYERNRFI